MTAPEPAAPAPAAGEPAGPAPAPVEPAPAEPAAAGAVDLVTVRRLWPEMLAVVAGLKRLTWTLISQNAQVQGVSDGRLTLGFSTPGLRDTFLGRSDHEDYVREALIQVLGVDWKVDAIVDPSTAPTEAAAAAPPAPPGPARPAAPSGRAAAEAAVAAQAAQSAAAPGVPAVEDTPSADDDDADDDALTHHDLLARELGAKVIGEYDAS